MTKVKELNLLRHRKIGRKPTGGRFDISGCCHEGQNIVFIAVIVLGLLMTGPVVVTSALVWLDMGGGRAQHADQLLLRRCRSAP